MSKRIFMILMGGILILGIGRLSFAKMCNMGGSKFAQAKGESEEGEIKTEAVEVGNKICPVSGERIDEKFKATYEYEGKIYNFCCPACVEEFKKDPQKYIQKVEEELKAQSQEETKEKIEQSSTMHEGHGQMHH